MVVDGSAGCDMLAVKVRKKSPRGLMAFVVVTALAMLGLIVFVLGRMPPHRPLPNPNGLKRGESNHLGSKPLGGLELRAKG